MRTPTYDSDMCDAEWEIIQPTLILNQGRGRKMQLSPRDILDAIRYVVRTGVQWRYLPKDFPKWQAVYRWKRKWTKDGTWQRIQEALQTMVRKEAKGEDKAEVNTGSVDSQSSKSAGTQEDRGFDKGKMVKGRKRHILVDSLGMILAVVVTSASCSDASGGEIVLKKCPSERYPELKTLYADGAYNREEFYKATESRGIKVIIPKKEKKQKGFVLLKHRWLVERTFGWLTRHRRLCRSYEHTTKAEEAFIRIAMISVCSRRLAKVQSVFSHKRPLKSDQADI